MSLGPAVSPLRSARLELEPLAVAHAGELAPVLDDPALHEYIGGEPATADELRRRYELQVVGVSPDGTETWLNWVLRRRDDGRPVGYVQATVTGPAGEVAEVAWVVAGPYQGQGYAREAAAAMVDWLRGQGVRTVRAHVHPEHGASAGVARALGLAPTAVVVDGETRWET